jgi:uncharacterized protein YbbC (DUF1343 family)
MHQLRRWVRTRRGLATLITVAAAPACTHISSRDPERQMELGRSFGHVKPGITVLLNDSVQLVRGKAIGLITNQTGVDEHGVSDVALLTSDKRATRAQVRLVALFSPEHGIHGTEDRTGIASSRDPKAGVPIHSLYTTTTIAPPDSTLKGLNALVFDLQDIGTRTWTYVGNLVYALKAAKRNGLPIIVLDRPDPINGLRRDGPMLDATLANAEEPGPNNPGQAYALYPFPLRHGMTMGEMARFYNETLGIRADLHVVPMAGWRRAMWFDETGLHWVRPSPNIPSLTSALLYPSLVALEASNVSVGRGTEEPFQRFGAPWLDAKAVVRLLADHELTGVRFEAEHFTPHAPGDGKYDGREIPGVRIVVTDREHVNVGRLGAAIVWALAQSRGDSLRITPRAFDLRFGTPAGRESLLSGGDPDEVVDHSVPEVVAFTERVRPFLLYH